MKNKQPKPNILVVCGKNKRRSRTAEYLFKNDARFHISSVGLSPKSDRKISEKDVLWANLIFVMEESQRKRVLATYRHLALPTIDVLEIEDDYAYLDPELIEMLEERINTTVAVEFGI